METGGRSSSSRDEAVQQVSRPAGGASTLCTWMGRHELDGQVRLMDLVHVMTGASRSGSGEATLAAREYEAQTTYDPVLASHGERTQ